jgi:MOSC domain-containing protein YiiM
MSRVEAVHSSHTHTFSKRPQAFISLVKGMGIAGDAHYGHKVKHRSRVRRDPTQPNLRQVHLIHSELYTMLADMGFELSFGQLGENITTMGVELLALGRDSRLLVNDAEITVTGLRNPCAQLDQLQQGLMAAVLSRDDQGRLIRKAGIMGVVTRAGTIYPGDAIQVQPGGTGTIPLEVV